jgi:hypothetical protein
MPCGGLLIPGKLTTRCGVVGPFCRQLRTDSNRPPLRTHSEDPVNARFSTEADIESD